MQNWLQLLCTKCSNHAKYQSAILGLAITKDKMQTTNYNLYPVYNTKDNSREIIGYSVSNEITVTIDNIDMVGTVIDTAINAGAVM